jgi:hypothetical protein
MNLTLTRQIHVHLQALASAPSTLATAPRRCTESNADLVSPCLSQGNPGRIFNRRLIRADLLHGLNLVILPPHYARQQQVWQQTITVKWGQIHIGMAKPQQAKCAKLSFRLPGGHTQEAAFSSPNLCCWRSTT